MGSGFLADTFSEALGEKDWALAREGGWVRGTGSNGSGSMLREMLEKVELQRRQDGREAFPCTIHHA